MYKTRNVALRLRVLLLTFVVVDVHVLVRREVLVVVLVADDDRQRVRPAARRSSVVLHDDGQVVLLAQLAVERLPALHQTRAVAFPPALCNTTRWSCFWEQHSPNYRAYTAAMYMQQTRSHPRVCVLHVYKPQTI